MVFCFSMLVWMVDLIFLWVWVFSMIDLIFFKCSRWDSNKLVGLVLMMVIWVCMMEVFV